MNESNSVVEIDNAEHYTWGQNCDGWHFAKTENISIIRERMPSQTAEKLHYHNNSFQFFYILSGLATFEIDGSTLVVGPSQGISIKLKQKHKILNNSTLDLTFIVIYAPPSHGDRIDLD